MEPLVRHIATPASLLLSLLCLLSLPALSEPPEAREAESRIFFSEAVEIHYVVLGEGSPVVLVHGYTSSGRSWLDNGIAERLARKHQVFVLDARGHGQSGTPQEVDEYGAQMATDIIALLDHEQIDRAHLAGYSMGGLLTIAAVTQAPERFLSAVVGGQGWAGDDVGLGEDITEEIAVALENGRGIEPLLIALATDDQPPMTEEQILGAAAWLERNNDPLALAAVIRSAPGWIPEREALAANPVPTIAVVGDADPLIAAARNLAGNMGNFQRLEVLVGASHVDVVRNPEFAPRFGALIEDFIAANEAD